MSSSSKISYNHLATSGSFEELKKAIEKYVKYYNEARIKAKLGYLSPVEYRKLNTA